MDKVLTITEWYDWPVFGVAFFKDEIVIFERIFSETEDEFTDEYTLTPISIPELAEIMRFWTEWVNHINYGIEFDRSRADPTIGILKKHTDGQKYKRKAVFHVNKTRGTILDGYWVEWFD